MTKYTSTKMKGASVSKSSNSESILNEVSSSPLKSAHQKSKDKKLWNNANSSISKSSGSREPTSRYVFSNDGDTKGPKPDNLKWKWVMSNSRRQVSVSNWNKRWSDWGKTLENFKVQPVNRINTIFDKQNGFKSIKTLEKRVEQMPKVPKFLNIVNQASKYNYLLYQFLDNNKLKLAPISNNKISLNIQTKKTVETNQKEISDKTIMTELISESLNNYIEEKENESKSSSKVSFEYSILCLEGGFK